MVMILLKLFLLTVILKPGSSGSLLKTAREQHRSQLSTNSDFRYLATLGDPNYLNKVLDNILIPRVVGTTNHEKVFKYIKNELKRLNWHVDVDEFNERVPIFGNVTFKNIVATPDPKADRFLVLACHYDSKYFKDVVFVGAIDSAVPCAMMLELARSLAQDLNQLQDSKLGLKFIFFDGEEAFENWGPRDSIYGAKHLAKSLYNKKSVINGETVNELDKIDILILLDLIGAKNSKFLNFFDSTQQWFDRLAQIEYDLHQANLLRKHRYRYFQSNRPFGRIEDDHLPFMEKNVPILHLISVPFPPEWHTPKDNRDIIDMDTVMNVNLILKTFVSEYLHLYSNKPGESNENPVPLIIICSLALTVFIYKNYKRW